MDEEEELRREKKKKVLKAIQLLLTTATMTTALIEPDKQFYRERLKWAEHVSQLHSEGPTAFFAMYRMGAFQFQVDRKTTNFARE